MEAMENASGVRVSMTVISGSDKMEASRSYNQGRTSTTRQHEHLSLGVELRPDAHRDSDPLNTLPHPFLRPIHMLSTTKGDVVFRRQIDDLRSPGLVRRVGIAASSAFGLTLPELDGSEKRGGESGVDKEGRRCRRV
jgi:hypothetical protein